MIAAGNTCKRSPRSKFGSPIRSAATLVNAEPGSSVWKIKLGETEGNA